MTAAARLLAESESGTAPVHELPVDPIFIGAGAFAILVALLLITLAFGKDR